MRTSFKTVNIRMAPRKMNILGKEDLESWFCLALHKIKNTLLAVSLAVLFPADVSDILPEVADLKPPNF